LKILNLSSAKSASIVFYRLRVGFLEQNPVKSTIVRLKLFRLSGITENGGLRQFVNSMTLLVTF